MYLIRMILTSKSVRVWSARLYSIFCKLLLKLYTWPLGLVSQGWTHGFPTSCRICTFLSLKDLSSWAGEQSKYHSLLDFFFFLFFSKLHPIACLTLSWEMDDFSSTLTWLKMLFSDNSAPNKVWEKEWAAVYREKKRFCGGQRLGYSSVELLIYDIVWCAR